MNTKNNPADHWSPMEETALNYVVEKYAAPYSKESIEAQQHFIKGFSAAVAAAIKELETMKIEDAKRLVERIKNLVI